MDKTSNSSDKMMDGFLLCDYLEVNEDYNGIYVSSEDEADEELYYERQLQEVQYQEQYENKGKNNPTCNEYYKEDNNEIKIKEELEDDEESKEESELEDDEELKDEELKDEESKDEESKDDEEDEELKDEELKDEELKDEESKDEESKDEESKDEELKDDELKDDEEDEEEDDEIEIQLEELKTLIIQIEDKIHLIETNNSNMITTTFFIDKKKYNTNLHDISILKNKKKEYEKSIEFIYRLLIIKNKLV